LKIGLFVCIFLSENALRSDVIDAHL